MRYVYYSLMWYHLQLDTRPASWWLLLSALRLWTPSHLNTLISELYSGWSGLSLYFLLVESSSCVPTSSNMEADARSVVESHLTFNFQSLHRDHLPSVVPSFPFKYCKRAFCGVLEFPLQSLSWEQFSGFLCTSSPPSHSILCWLTAFTTASRFFVHSQYHSW